MSKKWETATEADWSFMEDEEITEAIEVAARRAGRSFDNADLDDFRQDARLHLAVSPEMLERWRKNVADMQQPKARIASIANRIYGDLRKRLISESEREKLLTSFEDWEVD